MSIIQVPENRAHQTAIVAAEQARQAAVVPSASAATVKTAEIAFYRAVLASATANNSSSGVEQAIMALRELGTGGS
jgi:hypothetical protein